jgi:enoyl-CoA hydratase/carnithine racemase
MPEIPCSGARKEVQVENAFVLLEIQNNVGIVKLNHGPTNAINLDLVNQMADILRKAKIDPQIQGLVVTSHNDKFFSIGFNIPELIDLSLDDLSHFYKSFNLLCLELYTLPKPTIAAITGHAIAGGCILALCCDYRFIAQGRKLMGLNEIKLGLPVPYVADCILRNLVGLKHARQILEGGDFYLPEVSSQTGLVDQVLPLEGVITEAIGRVEITGSFPREAFAAIKRNRVEGIEKQILEKLEEKEQIFIQCWISAAGQKLLREAVTKF